jgi:hypothetical protein
MPQSIIEWVTVTRREFLVERGGDRIPSGSERLAEGAALAALDREKPISN